VEGGKKKATGSVLAISQEGHAKKGGWQWIEVGPACGEKDKKKREKNWGARGQGVVGQKSKKEGRVWGVMWRGPN